MFRAKAHRQEVGSKESEKTASIKSRNAETKRPKQKNQPRRLKQKNDVSHMLLVLDMFLYSCRWFCFLYCCFRYFVLVVSF